MLKSFLIRLGTEPVIRNAAVQLFRAPLLGPFCRRALNAVIPRGQRTWIQIPGGAGKGLWLKVEPYWEPGYVAGKPEPAVEEMIEQFLKPGDCFYDVGAHIGLYSFIAARLVGKKGRVLALEPDADNVAVLNEGLIRNGFQHVRVAQVAVWHSDGEVSFKRGEDAPSRMGGKVLGTDVQRSTIHFGGGVTARAVTLDTLADTDRPPMMIKIDVEGGEKQVLRGATSVLARIQPVLIVEIHDRESLDEVSQFLATWGYKPSRVCPAGVKVHVCFVV